MDIFKNFAVSFDDANDGCQHENMCIICGTCFTFVFNSDIRRHLCRVNMGGPNWRQPCSISYNHNQRIAVRCNALTFLIILVAFLGVPTQSVDTKVVKNAWEKSLFVCLQTETLNTCSCCCTHMQKESVACEATLNPVLVYQVQTHLWAQPQDFHSCFFFFFFYPDFSNSILKRWQIIVFSLFRQ